MSDLGTGDVHAPAAGHYTPIDAPTLEEFARQVLPRLAAALDDADAGRTVTMPFVSEAQRGWMHVHHPEMAKRWEKHTPKGADLPQHVHAADRGAAVVVMPDGNGRYLAVSRGGDPKDIAFPGGHVEPGEDPKAAAARELAEETGVRVTSDPATRDLDHVMTAPAGDVPTRLVHVYRATNHAALKAPQFQPEPGETVRWALPSELMAAPTFGAWAREHQRELFTMADTSKNTMPDTLFADLESVQSPAHVRDAAARLEQHRASLPADKYKAIRGRIAAAARRLGMATRTNRRAGGSVHVRADLAHGGAITIRHVMRDLGADSPGLLLKHLVCRLRAAYLTHQAAHWETKGVAFYGDHLMYERLYNAAQGDADAVAERVIGLFGGTMHDQDPVLSVALADVPATEDVRVRCDVAEHLALVAASTAYDLLKGGGQLTKGLDDLLLSVASHREEARYLLRQREVASVGALMSDAAGREWTAYTLRVGAEVEPAGFALRAPEGDQPKRLVWIQLAEVGAFRGHPAGAFALTPAVFAEVCANFEKEGIPVPIDYEHASEVPPSEGNIPVAGAPAQGWIHKLDNRGQAGLWGLVEWLPQARQQILDGAYRYISPAIRFGGKDRVTGTPQGAKLTSAGLTNQPFLKGMQRLAASDKDQGASALDVLTAEDDADMMASDDADEALLQDMLADAAACAETETPENGATNMSEKNSNPGTGTAAPDPKDRPCCPCCQGKDTEIASLQLQLKAAKATIGTLTGKVTELEAAAAKRADADLDAEADAIISCHDAFDAGDKGTLLRLLKADPDGVRAKWPVTSPAKPVAAPPSKLAYLTQRVIPQPKGGAAATVSAQPAMGEDGGAVFVMADGTEIDQRLLSESLSATTQRLMGEEDLSYNEASERAWALHRTVRNATAAR